MSHGNGSTCVIDKNLTINEVCKNYSLLDELKYTRLYALFLEQGSSEINAQQMLLIYNLITKTSNNAKNSNKNNIQPILFQSTGEIPEFIKPKNIEYIDISMSQLDEQINNLSSEECCWIRSYLSLYGLHLILKSQKSNLDFDLGCKLKKVFLKHQFIMHQEKNLFHVLLLIFLKGTLFLSRKQEEEKRNEQSESKILRNNIKIHQTYIIS